MALQFSQLKLIVGLGNPGTEYKHTRHNAGYIFVDELAQQLDSRVAWKSDARLKADMVKMNATVVNNETNETEIIPLIMAKPTDFMNNSGASVRAIADYYRISPQEILVAHDDLDINLGDFKIQYSKGPKVHNGVNSTEQHLGTAEFWRLRLGIENREVKGNKGIPGMDYALQRFTISELTTFIETVQRAIQEMR